MIKSSIIIPTAGRPIAIKSALQSLLDISLERYSAEVIVVDNNTSEELSSDLKKYIMNLNENVKYIREASPGLTAARHRGAYEAKGELLTFIDDDVYVSEKWLPSIQNTFLNSEIAMVGGPSIPKFTSSIPPWFWDYVTQTPYGGWMCDWLSLLDIGEDVCNVDPNYIWGLNFSIRKTVLESCGGFHIDLIPAKYQRWQGDGETGLTKKVMAAGYRADYKKNAFLYHLCGSDRLNVEYFKKRAYFQGICDSFSSIRSGSDFKNETTIFRSISAFRKAKAVSGSVMRKFMKINTPWSVYSSPVKRITDQAYREGWLFHQSQVSGDPELLAWIKRDNFIDIDLRDVQNI